MRLKTVKTIQCSTCKRVIYYNQVAYPKFDDRGRLEYPLFPIFPEMKCGVPDWNIFKEGGYMEQKPLCNWCWWRWNQ